ncbi:MAG: elongation factor G [Actinomycetota bacterium]
MKTYDASDIRNVLLVGHGGAGKTTLLEAMLFAAGTTNRMGTVEDGTTVSDHDPEEIRKAISVSLSMAPVEWEGVKINVLDAPGYADFVGDLRSAIRAVDAVLIVVSAVDGVQVQTEAAWELAVQEGLPRAFFVNKIDRERASFAETQRQLIQAFGKQIAPVELPIGEEHDFHGIADLLHKKADLYPVGPIAEEGDWPEDLAAIADPAREQLMEAVAEADDELIERYLEQGELEEKEIIDGVKAGFAQGTIAPVFVGSAEKAIGVDRLLAFIREEFPSPAERDPITVTTTDGSSEQDACDPNGPLAAYVFKTLSDPYVGHITMFRVFSGAVRPDATVHNERAGSDERVGQLFTVRGKEHDSVSEIPAGDIGGVAKLTKTHTGDTLSDKNHPVTIPAPQMPEPLLAYAIEPKTKGDEDKLSTALARLREEDPTLRIERSDETHETVLFGMGDAHLEVAVERMKNKYGVEVLTHPARIAYKETIRKPVEVTGRYVKQSGGHGQYAVCSVKVEPLPHGSGFEYVDKIVGGAVPHQFIPSVEKGVRKTMAEGVAAGYPMVDIRVTLFDGKAHSVDSSDMSFQIAGSMALKEAIDEAGVNLLEPVVELEVVVPEDHTGDVMGDLNAKRAKIQGVEQASVDKQLVKALVPQAEVARYAIDLRSITGGRGAFTMAFSHYEEVPPQIAEKIVAGAKSDAESGSKH